MEASAEHRAVPIPAWEFLMPKFLVVDDSRFARLTTIQAIREHFADAEIVEAASGEDALEILRAEPIDFATIDLNMPGIDGIELKRTIDGEKPGLQAVLVTANIQDAVRERANGHFVDFLEKPVRADQLGAVLEAHVAR